jgi:formyltetrahydrofolate synthetase
MMVKTHESLSHDRTIKGVPKGWTLPIRDVLIYSGAKFLCPCAGTISLMPGTGLQPGLPPDRRGYRNRQSQLVGLF